VASVVYFWWMRVRELREFLDGLDDETEVIVHGNHGVLHRANAKTGYAEPFNRMGQTHAGDFESASYTNPVVIIGDDTY